MQDILRRRLGSPERAPGTTTQMLAFSAPTVFAAMSADLLAPFLDAHNPALW
jgi:hypothetical protein